jgi:hypothetical protein
MKKLLSAGLIIVIFTFLTAMFTGCGTAEVQYTLSDDGTYYIASGVSGSKSALVTYQMPDTYTDEATGITLPIKEIGTQAFYGCTSLRYIELPDTITTIGGASFMLCKLTSIKIPDSVTTIEYSAFAMNTGLKEVEIPESVTNIGQNAFYGCSSLEKAVVKANIEDLKAGVFGNSVVTTSADIYTNTSLTEIYLSASIKKINEYALYGNFITDVYYAGDAEQWNEVYFYYYEQIEDTDEYKEVIVDKDEMVSGINLHLSANF